MRATLFISCLLFTISIHGQTNKNQIDTIEIYKNKSGVKFKVYMHTWFQNYGVSNSYSYNQVKLNHQDSLVIVNNDIHYFKIYNNKNRLIMIGQNSYVPYLTGDIKIYNSNSKIKRIEHYDNTYSLDTCNSSIILNDAPGKEGKWYYFNNKGQLKKTVEYYIYCKSCVPLDYIYRKRIIKYKHNGKPKHSRIVRYRR